MANNTNFCLFYKKYSVNIVKYLQFAGVVHR